MLVLHGRSVGYAFVHDDVPLLETSQRLKDPGNLGTALTKDLFWLADGNVRPSPYWRPVVTLSYFVDQATGGGDPGSFHVTNLLLLCALAGLAARPIASPLARALTAASLVVHPMMLEAAANVTARTDLLAAVFAVAALQSSGPAAFVLTLLALGSKEVAVVLPVAAFLVHGKANRRAWLPPLLAVGVWALVRFPLVQGLALAPEDRGWPTLESLFAAPFRMGTYLARLVVPIHPTPALQLSQPDLWLGAATGVALALGVGLLLRHRDRSFARPLGTMLLALVPVTGWLAAPVRYAEGFLVWPLVGFLTAWALTPRLCLVLGALLPVWAFHTFQSAEQWRDSRTLWETAHAHWPQDPLVAGNLGRIRLASGDPEGALPLLDQALQGDADPRHQRELHLAMGVATSARGLSPEALGHFRLAVGPLDDPEATPAIQALCLYGAETGQTEDLVAVCEEAVRRLPDCAGCRIALETIRP